MDKKEFLVEVKKYISDITTVQRNFLRHDLN